MTGRRVAAGIVAVVVVAGALTVAVRWPRSPGDDSVDAGFARDMTVHHAQAVEMGEAIRKRSTDDELGFFAKDLVLTQQAQIGQMGGWLDVWGLNRTSFGRPPMAWADMSMGTTMPGMATRDDVASLSTLPIDQAEVKFLQLMVLHHRGGIHMAQEALKHDLTPPARRLAASIVTSQQSEINAMTDMLERRGATAPG